MTIDWLNDLERAVQAAAEELNGLRKQARTLKTRVQRLEKQLKAAQEGSTAEESRQREDQQIRRRVEKLADGLERLLES